MTKRKSNIIDKIGTLIPGYDGYSNRLMMRQTDKKLREQCCGNMKQVEEKLENLLKKLIANSQYDEMINLENTRKSINTIVSKIQFAPYGESGFFGKEVIKEDELSKIHEYDLELIERTESMKVISFNHIDLPISIMAILNHISQISDLLNERNQFIQNFN